MVKVSYHPEPGASDDTAQFGYDFKGGKPTEVTDERALAKFRGNRFFKVHKAEKEDKKADAGLKAMHNGGGRFVIKDGDKILKEGLTKADADAFNALSVEDQVEYVKD